jgi:cytochrome c peroxidase
MHDGSVPWLGAVIDRYDRGGIDRPSRAAEIHHLGLTMDDKADLIAFLRILSGISQFASLPKLPR